MNKFEQQDNDNLQLAVKKSIIQGMINAIYLWGRDQKYIFLNPEISRLIKVCGWQKMTDAILHGKSENVKKWFMEKYKIQNVFYGENFIKENNVTIPKGVVLVTDSGSEFYQG